MFKDKKGFTLIELLVVIAIIGILSSVVLASLNSARNKGKDASAVGSMNAMRAQAELTIGSDSNYGANLFASGTMLNLVNAVATQVGAANIATSSNSSAASSWGIAAKLNNSGTFCVDSTGFAGASTTITTAAGALNGQACR